MNLKKKRKKKNNYRQRRIWKIDFTTKKSEKLETTSKNWTSSRYIIYNTSQDTATQVK